MSATAEQIRKALKVREEQAWERINGIEPAHEAWGQAIAERRKAYAQAFIRYRDAGRTVRDSEILADQETAHLKAQEVAAEGVAKASLEAARLARDQLSAGQTIANAYRIEHDLTRTGGAT